MEEEKEIEETSKEDPKVEEVTEKTPKEETKEEVKESVKEEKEEFSERKKTKLTIKILIIVLSVLIIGGAGYVTYHSFFGKSDSKEKNIVNNVDNDKDDDNIKEGTTPTGTANKLYIACNKDSQYCFVSDISNPINSDVKATYNCTNESCKGFEVNNKYAIIHDDYYYIYDYISNKATKVDLGTENFKTLNIIADDKTFYGIVATTDYIKETDKKVAFYSLEKNKYTIDFDLKYNNIYAREYMSSGDFSPALSKGYIFANIQSNINNNYSYTSYIIEMNTGKVVLTVTNTESIEAVNKNQTMYYLAYEYSGEGIFPVKFYNSKFEPLFDGKSYNIYQFKDNGNIILGSDKTFSDYNSSGQLVKNSRDFKSVEKIVKDYVIVIDTDNYLKIVNYNGDVVATFIEMSSNLYLHSMLSGYYEPENKPYGVYLVVEDKNKPEQNGMGVGNEYYYDTKNKTTGVIENITIGGYAKPVLYLYPKVKTNITVTFEKPNLLTTTYPKFNNGWKVVANSNGDLYDSKGNYYYALYWEESGSTKVDFKTGFYVTKDNAIKFLEDKLSIIGLNDKERNEFIMYWLPILEKNNKSLVYFELTEERDSYNKLIITPTPDSLLRLAIHVKKVDNKVNIKEQELKTFKRSGFSAVEWGGVIH